MSEIGMREILERIKQGVESTIGPVRLRVPGETAGSAVGSPGQGIQKQRRIMLEYAFKDFPFDMSYLVDALTRMDVGDMTRKMGYRGYDVGMSLPVATDVWYLAISGSILPFQGENYKEDAAKIIEILQPMFDALGGIAPLRSIQQYSDLSAGFDPYRMRTVYTGSAPYVIREARYETWMMNRNTAYPTKGSTETSEEGRTKIPESSEGQLYGGLISFPVGPMGVMEVLSLWSETMGLMKASNVDFAGDVPISVPEDWQPVKTQVMDGLMSPMTDLKGECPGVHLVEKGYKVTHRDCEYPAPDVGDSDKLQRLASFRFYLHREARWPLPGEFVALLAKPFPTHVWWFQDTSPVFYAGNWIETAHYTTGKVLEVCEPDDGSPGKIYRVYVRGCEMYLAATDFYEYEVGDTVAILKLSELDRVSDKKRENKNYYWTEMENMIQRKKVEDAQTDRESVVTGGYLVLPIEFYKKEG